MEYFKSLTATGLTELIKSARKRLYLCLPSLHPEISDAIAELNFMENLGNGDVKINILIDFDAQTFRQGYGDFVSLEELFREGHEIKCLKDNRISFIISDDIGYYLFIESRSLIPADKVTINAVRIDPVSMVRLKKFFFPEAEKTDFKNELANAIIEESKTLSEPEKLMPEKQATVTEISENEIKELKTSLEQNPPLNPDFKRTVEFYSNKFQYAEIHYKGQNIEHLTIEIPSKLLPYKNTELRKKFITRLKLFENINKSEDFVKFKTVEECKNQISEDYLTPITCRKGRSVLKKELKGDFEKEVASLQLKLNDLKTGIYKVMSEEIETAKTNLCETMRLFLLDNPTEDMLNMGPNNHDRMAKNISKALTDRINVDPARLITKFKIDCHFADITFEDLSDSELLKEFKEKELIDEADETNLAVFSKGIKITVGM